MSQKLEASLKSEIIYPESDGKPMAENTEQFTWIVVIKENLEILFANNSDVFVAGDLLWYPVEGNNKLCQAPDALVVFGRPKGKRGSYKQWEEEDIPPQVVFEVLSPGNTLKEMAKKWQFYDRYGVEEYYLYDPDRFDLTGWQRSETQLTVIEEMNGWVSPRLGIRFEMTESGLEIYRPDGRRFLTPIELDRRAQEAEQREQVAQQRIQQLEARLRELGIDPEQV